MPALLSEMGSLSILSPQNYSVGTDRFHNSPPVQPEYKDYTVIDDIMTCQTALPPGTTMLPSMPEYNSNSILPGYNKAVCPSSVQQAYMNLSRPGALPFNQYLVPNQQQSFHSYVNQYNAKYPQFDTTFIYPPFAGAVPQMKNARATDQTLPLNDGVLPPMYNPAYLPPPLMPSPQAAAAEVAKEEASSSDEASKEGFQMPQTSCSQCLRHMDSCRICKQFLGYNTQKYKWIILILLLVIAGLLFYIILNRKHHKIVESLRSAGSGGGVSASIPTNLM